MMIIIIRLYKSRTSFTHCEKWRTYTTRRLFLDQFVQGGEMDCIRPPNCFLQPNTEGALLSQTSIETHPPPPIPRALPEVTSHVESCMTYICVYSN